jgi:transcriptional regulator with XRE-family HTH domain
MRTINRRVLRADHRDLMRRVGGELRHLREDAGRSQATIAAVAGVAQGHLSRIEAGTAAPSVEVLMAISAALGADLSIRVFPQSGPRIRDHIQVAMSETLLAGLAPRWRPSPEVPVYRPIRGVIDVVLQDGDGPDTVASELHSQLRRVEQQVRWSVQKADALAASPDQAGRRVSRLLVVRNTASMRDVMRAASSTLGAAYPARAADAIASLCGDASWPGAAILWIDLRGTASRLLDGPPRGVTVGR